MGGGTSRFDETDWARADGTLSEDCIHHTVDGSVPTPQYRRYELQKRTVGQREFDVIRLTDASLLYTTKAVSKTVSWFDVLGPGSCGDYVDAKLRVTSDALRRTWIVYRYHLPVFEGQKPCQDPAVLRGIEPGILLFRTACITVSWSRYVVVAARYGPPDWNDFLFDDDQEAVVDQDVVKDKNNTEDRDEEDDEDAIQSPHQLAMAASAGNDNKRHSSISDDPLFAQAKQIAARRRAQSQDADDDEQQTEEEVVKEEENHGIVENDAGDAGSVKEDVQTQDTGVVVDSSGATPGGGGGGGVEESKVEEQSDNEEEEQKDDDDRRKKVDFTSTYDKVELETTDTGCTVDSVADSSIATGKTGISPRASTTANATTPRHKGSNNANRVLPATTLTTSVAAAAAAAAAQAAGSSRSSTTSMKGGGSGGGGSGGSSSRRLRDYFNSSKTPASSSSSTSLTGGGGAASGGGSTSRRFFQSRNRTSNNNGNADNPSLDLEQRSNGDASSIGQQGHQKEEEANANADDMMNREGQDATMRLKLLYELALEGVIDLDTQPIVQCQEVYNKMIGNHQTFLMTKEEVIKLLQMDEKQHDDGQQSEQQPGKGAVPENTNNVGGGDDGSESFNPMVQAVELDAKHKEQQEGGQQHSTTTTRGSRWMSRWSSSARSSTMASSNGLDGDADATTTTTTTTTTSNAATSPPSIDSSSLAVNPNDGFEESVQDATTKQQQQLEQPQQQQSSSSLGSGRRIRSSWNRFFSNKDLDTSPKNVDTITEVIHEGENEESTQSLIDDEQQPNQKEDVVHPDESATMNPSGLPRQMACGIANKESLPSLLGDSASSKVDDETTPEAADGWTTADSTVDATTSPGRDASYPGFGVEESKDEAVEEDAKRSTTPEEEAQSQSSSDQHNMEGGSGKEEVAAAAVVDDNETTKPPLVGYFAWKHTTMNLAQHKMMLHLAKNSDLALHVVLSIIVNQVRSERNHTVFLTTGLHPAWFFINPKNPKDLIT